MAENMLMGNSGGNVDTSMYRIAPIQPQNTNPLNMLTQATDAARGMQALQQQQFDYGQARYQALNSAFGALAGMRNPTFDNVTHIAGQLIASKMFSAEEIARRYRSGPA